MGFTLVLKRGVKIEVKKEVPHKLEYSLNIGHYKTNGIKQLDGAVRLMTQCPFANLPIPPNKFTLSDLNFTFTSRARPSLWQGLFCQIKKKIQKKPFERDICNVSVRYQTSTSKVHTHSPKDFVVLQSNYCPPYQHISPKKPTHPIILVTISP